MDDVTPERIERLAQFAHETYLQSSPNSDRDEAARCGWDDGLSERFKDSNRDAVRHKLDELARLGYIVVREARGAQHSRFSLDEHLEGLAEREHNRWIDFMIEAGYCVGRHRCDDPPNKTHPDLVPWEELSNKTQEKDRAPWREFTEHLAQLDLIVVQATEKA